MGQDGRGRLGSIDLIPEEGQDDIVWALSELNQRQRTQADILFELNERLAEKGIDPVSKSAFNRRAVRMANAARRIQERRELFSGIADQFTPDTVDEGNIVIGELIKTLITEILDKPNHSPKETMELARAYQATIQGQKISSDRRQRLQEEFAEKTTEVVEKVASEAGLSKERVDQLKREFLGLRT